MGYQYVLKGLAQGSAPPPGQSSGFDVIVLCAVEYQPAAKYFQGSTVVYAPIDDAIPTKHELATVNVASKDAYRAYTHGKRVLITCRMGLNRSGLVMGLVLMQLGYNSMDAITLIRRARGGRALGNPHFREVLHRHSRCAAANQSQAL